MALRPHIVSFVGLVLLLVCSSTADAGRRGRKTKKSRVPAQAQKQSRAEPAPPPAISPAGPGERLARGESGAPAGKAASGKPREKVFDFTGFELAGSERMPQLLYFLDRAEEELERASLERRSFVPELMRSLDEESL